MSDIQEVVEGTQEQRRSEGIVYSITTTNWASAPVPADITITKLADGSDATGDFTSTATPTVASDVITLPEITIPSTADLGEYQVNTPFTVDGFSPGIPYFIIEVIE